MSSFAAYLEVQGVQYPLLTYTLMIHQETDALGRPASPTLGGTIYCVLAAPGSDQPFLVQWMFSPTMQQDGRVVLMQDVPRTTMKTISFFNAYCTGLQTNFQPGAGGGGSLQMQLQISPQRVAVGAIVHDNNWPVESHGAGQSFAKSITYSDKPAQPKEVQKPMPQVASPQLPALPQNNLQQKEYSMDPKEVKKVMDAKLKGESYDKEQFQFYHYHRNYFNVKNEVTSLKKIEDDKYKDNLGNVWTELTWKNWYHMPKPNYFASRFGTADPYSRKFVRNDDVSGLGGEFEMIIRKDGKRINSTINDEYQETYNFGRTENSSVHKALDVDPHDKNNPGYINYGNMGSVEIHE